MPADLDLNLQPDVIPCHTLSAAQRFELVEYARRMCTPYLDRLPYAKTINDHIASEKVGYQLPLRTESGLVLSTKCFQFFRTFKSSEEAEDVISWILLTTDSRWVLWTRKLPNYDHLTLLGDTELKRLLGEKVDLVLGILKGLREAAQEAERRARGRMREYALLENDLRFLHERFGFAPSSS